MYTNESQLGPHYWSSSKTDSGIIRHISHTNKHLLQCKEALGSHQYTNLKSKRSSSVFGSLLSPIRNASKGALRIVFFGLIIVPVELYTYIKYR